MRKVGGTKGAGGSGGRGRQDGTEMVEEIPEDVFQSISEVTGGKIRDEMKGRVKRIEG